jgi:hypothetical protein
MLSVPITAGATGGFAGGEKGLKQYIETGDIQLRDPRQPGKQFSPVSIAALLVVAGAGGGLLLNELTDLGEIAVRTEITNVSRLVCASCRVSVSKGSEQRCCPVVWLLLLLSCCCARAACQVVQRGTALLSCCVVAVRVLPVG